MAIDHKRFFRALQRHIDILPARFAAALGDEGDKLAFRALDAITQEPGPVHYPIRWQSDRQRQAFFATDGFGAGIPYSRTGRQLRSWAVEVGKSDEGANVILYNPSDVTEFIQGPHTQMFHLDTGWPQIADIEEMFYDEVVDNGIEIYYDLTVNIEVSG